MSFATFKANVPPLTWIFLGFGVVAFGVLIFLDLLDLSIIFKKQNVVPELTSWSPLIESVNAADRIKWFYDEYAIDPSNSAGQLFTELDDLQNPLNCSTARLCVKTSYNPSGFGSNVHEVAQQLLVCHATNRTLVVTPNVFRYGQEVCPDNSNDCLFERLSSCRRDGTVKDAQDFNYAPQLKELYGPVRALNLPHVDKNGEEFRLNYLPQAPLGVYPDGPRQWGELSRKLQPLVPRWYWSHVVAYEFRPNQMMRGKLDERIAATGYGSDDFTIGIQLRGGNKGEGFYKFGLSTYVEYADRWLRRQPTYRPDESKVGVYLMTDEYSANQATSEFPQYRWMTRQVVDTSTEIGSSRVTAEQAISVVVDSMLVASADFNVGGFESNLGRLVMELAIAYHPGLPLEQVSCQLSFYDKFYDRHYQAGPFCHNDNNYDR